MRKKMLFATTMGVIAASLFIGSTNANAETSAGTIAADQSAYEKCLADLGLTDPAAEIADPAKDIRYPNIASPISPALGSIPSGDVKLPEIEKPDLQSLDTLRACHEHLPSTDEPSNTPHRPASGAAAPVVN